MRNHKQEHTAMYVSNAKMMRALQIHGKSLIRFYAAFGAKEFYSLVNVAVFIEFDRGVN